MARSNYSGASSLAMLQKINNPSTWRAIRFVAQLMLAVFVGQQLAAITWRLILPPPSETPYKLPSAPAISVAKPLSSAAVSTIAGLTLFGQPPAEAAQSTEVAPVSTLPAQITGLAASSVPENSMVIIKLNNQQGSYRIGDVIKTSSAKVNNIFPDRVVINNNGRLETILMYPDAPNKPKEPAVAALSMTDAQNWQDLISVTPHNQGYALQPGRKPQLFHSVGLQAGDIATHINGVDLTDPVKAMQLMSDIQRAPNLTLLVLRNGNTVSVNIQLKK